MAKTPTPGRHGPPEPAPAQELTQALRALFPDLCLNGPAQHKKRLFLWSLSQQGKVGAAAAEAGVGRTTTYLWRLDPAFASACERAKLLAVETLEDALIQRAVDGVETGIYWEGKRVATERKYSDTATIFMLKGLLPHKYAERRDVSHGVSPAMAALLRQWERLKAAPAPDPRALPAHDYTDAELVPLPEIRRPGQPSEAETFAMLDRVNQTGAYEDEH